LWPDRVFPNDKGHTIDLSYACYRHDMVYLAPERSWRRKFWSDWELCLDVWYLADQVDDTRKYLVKALAPCMGLAVALFGTPLYAWGTINRKIEADICSHPSRRFFG